ncbi:hypothetical protein CTI12_AA439190 [Artemisia annua]|uniref:Uncharacterized protein n=1 Tax=Artemisia annua TaxID=35608 RepID=A0A2U1LYR0_ARTAN|nr:hypothetical protein CTI12_AA439190 [Artemisia annua]
MKRWSELLDRMANVEKQTKTLEHRDALRRANALRLRADEYLWSAKTFRLWAKALHQQARAFGLQVNAFKQRLNSFVDSNREIHGIAKHKEHTLNNGAAAATCPNHFI